MQALPKVLLATLILAGNGLRPAFAQQMEPAAIQGAVRSLDDGAPIAGAVVRVERDGKLLGSATTGAEGRYVVEDLKSGLLQLNVSLIGWTPRTRSIDLEAGGRHTVDFTLAVDPIVLLPLEVIGESPHVYRKLTGTVTRLDGKVVDLIRPVGTQELLEMVPGINGYADDGFANSRLSIGIRGLNPRRSSRVLVLEDGVPIQPALYVYPNMYYNPPSERINAVEVIKGSSAIRFGPHTMGGVINYTTRRPGQAQGTAFQLTGGNNGYFSLFSELSGLGPRGVKSDLQLLYKRGNGFRDNNGFHQVNGTLKSHFFLSDGKVLYLKANLNRESSHATYTGLTEYSFRTDPNFNPKEDDIFKVLRASLDLIYTRKMTPRLTSNLTVYLSVFDRQWWREDDVFVRAAALEKDDPTPVPYFTTGDLVRVGGGRGNFGILRTFYVGGVEQSYGLKHASGRLELGARGHWERFIDDKKIGDRPDARDGIYYTGTPGDERDPPVVVGQSHHYETAALALYVNERVERGRWTFSPGLRFEYFRQDRVDRLQGSILADKVSYVLLPGVGVNCQLGPINLFGGIHRGYTPPSSGTLKVTNFGQDVAVGGLDLEPEKSWNLELGIRSRRPGIRVEASAFRVTIDDLVAAGRGTAFKNLGRVETRGLELGLRVGAARLSPLLPDVRLSYAFLHTEIKSGIVTSGTIAGNVDVDLSGNELPYAPRHTLTLGLVKEVGAARLRADWRFVDQVFTDFENIEQTFNRGDTGPIPSYSILNASVEYKVASRWTLFAAGKNLLDEIYIGSRLHSNAGQPAANLSSGILIGPRRQVNLGIKRGIR